MKIQYLLKEYPFLAHFFGWYFPDKGEQSPQDAPASYVKNLAVKRLGTDVLNTVLDVWAHSFAGSSGCSAWFVNDKGEYRQALEGSTYSNNGTITESIEAYAIWESFINNGQIDDHMLAEVEAIVVRDWNHREGDSDYHDNYTVYLRPRRAELRQTIEREFRKELAKLTTIVEG
jgi:hypothetical protein